MWNDAIAAEMTKIAMVKQKKMEFHKMQEQSTQRKPAKSACLNIADCTDLSASDTAEEDVMNFYAKQVPV